LICATVPLTVTDGLPLPETSAPLVPAVLALHEGLGRRGARQHDVLVLADHVLRLAGLAEQELVDLGLPFAEPRAGKGAERTPSVAVDARVRTVLLQLDGFVVLVAEDVERTRHDARGTPGAQPREHDLVVEVPPLRLVGAARHPGEV